MVVGRVGLSLLLHLVLCRKVLRVGPGEVIGIGGVPVPAEPRLQVVRDPVVLAATAGGACERLRIRSPAS